VRYVLQAQGDKNTVLRINAVFIEGFRRSSHPSNGSVEGAEYKDIHDRLESLQIMRDQTAEIQRERESAKPRTGAQTIAESSSRSTNRAAADELNSGQQSAAMTAALQPQAMQASAVPQQVAQAANSRAAGCSAAECSGAADAGTNSTTSNSTPIDQLGAEHVCATSIRGAGIYSYRFG